MRPNGSMKNRWWKLPICWYRGHRWLGWVKVLVCMPEGKPKEFNTCSRCGWYASRKAE